MITLDKFKEIIDKVSDWCEIGIYFNNDFDDYLIINFNNYITICRFDCTKNKRYKFKSMTFVKY